METAFFDIDALTDEVTRRVEKKFEEKYELIPKDAERWVTTKEFKTSCGIKKRTDWIRNEFFQRYPDFVDNYVLIQDPITKTGDGRRHIRIELYGAKRWLARHRGEIDWRG